MKIQRCRLDSFRSISCLRYSPDLAVGRDDWRVVVCFDGQALPALLERTLPILRAELNRTADNLSSTGWLFVGVDSSSNHRKAEYVMGVDADRYEVHRAFVFESVLPWIEKELGSPLDQKHTALFGCSFGGVAALQLGFVQQDRIGAVLAFSPVGLPSEWIVPVSSDCPLPLVYLLAGSREAGGGLWKQVQRTERKLQKAGAVTESKLVGGGTHSYSLWGPELAHALRWWQGGVALDEVRG